MTKQQIEENRRLTVYRAITAIERWETTLCTLRDYSRANAVAATSANNSLAHAYYNGKADGIEELIQKCLISKSQSEV